MKQLIKNMSLILAFTVLFSVNAHADELLFTCSFLTADTGDVQLVENDQGTIDLYKLDLPGENRKLLDKSLQHSIQLYDENTFIGGKINIENLRGVANDFTYIIYKPGDSYSKFPINCIEE